MKVPIPTSPTTAKPLSYNNSTLNTTNPDRKTASCFEPASVLDLKRSPSSSPAAPPNIKNHPQSTVDLDNLEGWDSILSELGINDDNTPNMTTTRLWSQISPSDAPHLSQLTDFPSSQPFDHNQPQINLPSSDHYSFNDFPNLNTTLQPLDLPPQQQNTSTVGLDFIDDLIQAAQAYESNDSNQIQLILSRLNQRLRSSNGKPLQRVAFYFKEALQRLVSGTTRPNRLSSLEVVNTIQAFKVFSGISPVSLFSAFAANQAILEAVDGSSFIHIIDFDIGFGGHWASFMRELVDNSDPNKLGSMMLRITAIVPDEFGIESKLVRENLTQFARDLNINFYIDFVMIQSFEILSFKSVKFIDDERIAVHLSPSVFQRLGSSRTVISKFITDLRSISPCVIVVVDKEIGIDTGTASFSVNFTAGIELYTGLLESLDVASAGGFAGGGNSVRRIEMFVLVPRIMAAVEAAATAAGRRLTWREAFVTAGIRAVGFSQFADFQSECLLRRAQVGGFHVAKRHGEMMLYWHDRPLVSTSAWKC